MGNPTGRNILLLDRDWTNFWNNLMWSSFGNSIILDLVPCAASPILRCWIFLPCLQGWSRLGRLPWRKFILISFHSPEHPLHSWLCSRSSCRGLAYASVPEVHTQLIMPQLKFIPKYENPECMTGGRRLIACHIHGDLGICPSAMLSSEGPTSEPSTVFGRGAE